MRKLYTQFNDNIIQDCQDIVQLPLATLLPLGQAESFWRERMNPEKREFLSLAIQPARLSLTEAAWFLGFSEHDISALISVDLLKPLGHPPASGSKYFALADLQTLRTDPRWLARASDATVKHWKKKNAGRRSSQPAMLVDCAQ